MSNSADPPTAAIPNNATPLSSRSRTRWAWLAGTFFGAGLLQPGPGTYGSVAAMLLWLAAAYGLHLSTGTLAAATAVAAALAIAVGIPAGTIVARESGRNDPGFVVLDEVAGQWIALLWMPPHWKAALISLLWFRLLDILKPPPARQLERLHGGVGIMLDDVAAGIYALVLAHAVQHWLL